MTRRQVSEDEIYFVVKNPRTGSFLRMGEVEVAVLRLLDGSRTPPEVAEALAAAHGYTVPASAIESFVAAIDRRGLLESSAVDPQAFREEWRRQRRARTLSMGQLLGNLTSLQVKLFDPSRLFARIVGPLGFLWTPGFLVCSGAFILAAGIAAFSYWSEILESAVLFFRTGTSSAGSFVSHASIVYAVFFIIVAVHECSHGMTCTRFGGKVTDMGFILFYLQVPGFYCDITDAYGFERRSHRLWTGLAGGYSGLVLGALGVFLWWMTSPGALLNGASIVLMVIGSGPLLILNWNPLIRLDGYYILMDLLEAPNLMANSFKYLGYVIKTRLLCLPADPMAVVPRLRKVYLIYGLAAFLFLGPLIAGMPLILFTVFRGMVGDLLALGIAVLLGARMLKKPISTAFSTLRHAWLTHRPAAMAVLSGQRGRARAALMSVGGVAVAALFLVGPRFPVRVQATGSLEPWERIEVRAFSSGFVTPAGNPRCEGDRVHEGDVLVVLENSQLQAESRASDLDLTSLRLDVSRLEAEGLPALAGRRRAQELSLVRRREVLQKRSEALVLRSPLDGVVLTPRLQDRAGSYLEEGQVWCVIGSTDRLRVRLPLHERDLGAIRSDSPARLKALHLPGNLFEGRVARLPAGRRPAPPRAHAAAAAGPAVPALGNLGGTLAVEIQVDNTSGLLRPGMTVHVRVHGERLSLLGHAGRWAHRLFKGKVWW